ncbi:MAG: hypothetical protein LC687_02640, partial [Actinobacteria bacterium]|nr:hypothetical protein [Actinomycetota bacterium]
VITYANNVYVLGGNDGSNYLSDVQFATIGYKDGTISQSGNTLSGAGTSWTASMVGSQVQYADGSTSIITGFTNATTLTVNTSKDVDLGTRYLIDDGSVSGWSFTTSLTQQVSDADGFAVNGFMYLFGGRSAEGVCTNNSYVAPISANTTIASGNNPTGLGEWYQTNVEYSGARRNAAVAYNEGKVYLSGGGCANSNSTTYTFDADNDADESAWTFVSDNGDNGLNPSGTTRAWSHETGDTPSGGVGPTSGQGGDPDGYVYTEASAPTAGNDTFTMTRNTTIDASAYDWTVEFYWNQRGDDNTAVLELQTNENGAGWVTRGTYGGGDQPSGAAQVWNFESEDLSSVISDASTEIRFLVTLPAGGTTWNNDFGLDTITVRGVQPGSSGELTSNQHYYGTLRAQPQVARYSYYIDADSNVFPDAWLLNGLDNNIGARWQFGYRSAVDDTGPLAGVKTIELTNFQDDSQNFREIDILDENDSELSYTVSDGGSMTYFAGTSLARINDGNISTAGADDYQVHPTNAISRTITMTLASPEEVGRVLFYNRTSCCDERIGGADMVFKDSSGDVLYT